MSCRQARKLDERSRRKFADAGWKFGKSVLNVIRCPACPKGAEPDPEVIEIKAALEVMLGGDEDGLAATFEDLGF